MKKDDIAENVLKHGKEWVKQNIIEVLDDFIDDFADEMWKAVEEVIKLRAENAALRERFVSLNKMPCNIGDTIYVLFGACYKCEEYIGDHCSCEKRGKEKIFKIKVRSVWFDRDDYYLYEDPIGISSGLSCSGRNYGKTWFLSLEEAETYLTEREEKGC